MTGYILLDTPNGAQPQGTYPRRGGAKLSGTAIVHTSEGNWRSGVDGLTNLVRIRADWGCYHQACDWVDIARYYPWEWETWQDTETNNWAVGIAAACRTSDWGNMPADIEDGYYRNMARMAADFVVYMRDVHGITVPLKRISGAQARARVPGFAAHGDSGVARSDPGANFNWSRFFNYTAQALGGIQLQSGTTITPLEDTLSAAEVKEIKAHINAVLLGGYEWGGKKHPGIGMVVEENQRRISALPDNVWKETVLRGGKKISVKQELADSKSKLLGLEPVIVEILENTSAEDVAATIPDNMAQQVIDALAARLNGAAE